MNRWVFCRPLWGHDGNNWALRGPLTIPPVLREVIFLEIFNNGNNKVRRISPNRSFTVTDRILPDGPADWLEYHQVEDIKKTIKYVDLHVKIATIGELKQMCQDEFKIDVIDGQIVEANLEDSQLPSDV